MKARNHNHIYRPRVRTCKPLLRIYCEGTTEKYYFKQVKYRFRDSNLQVKLKIKEKKDAQDQLIESVKKTINYENINLEDDKEDSIWCVIDVEENKLNWDSTVEKIKSFQNNKNKFVIVSNPSFEVWLLLFFKYSTRRYTNKELCEELTQLLKVRNYSRQIKGKNIRNYMDYFKDVDKAIKAAKKQVKFHKGRDLLDYESNPVTQIYKIFEKLMG